MKIAALLAVPFGLCSSCQLASAQGAADGPAGTRAERDPVERAFELSEKVRPPSGAHAGWLPDGKSYLALDRAEGSPRRQLVAVDVATGTKRPLIDAPTMAAAFGTLPGISAETATEWAGGTSFQFDEAMQSLVLNRAGDLFTWTLGAEKAVRLTNDPSEEVGETFSPDGSLVAWVSDYDIHLAPTAGGAARALTDMGDEDHLIGRLDWVYQEEIYGRGNFQAYWWSPDSRRIAFLALDERDVPRYTIVDDRETHPEVEVWRYPKAGDPNPKVRLGVIEVAGGAPRFLELPYPAEDLLIVRVGWTPDAKEILFQVQDRVQTWLDVLAADPSTGKVRVLFREKTPAWVEPGDGPWWCADGQRFLWRSERDGWAHLYLYDREGALLGRLTEGPWEVDAVHGIAPGDEWVYFSGDREDVKGGQLFRVKLDGSGLTRVTERAGTHGVSVAPDFAHFVDSFSAAADPGRVDLCRIDGTRVRELAVGDAALAAKAALVAPEFHKVPTRDGFEMEAMLILPPGFDPSRRYPVIQHTYSGPHAPQVRDAFPGFNGLWHQMLAQEGYLVFVCDNRSASGKGLVSAATSWRNFGEPELRDLEDALDWLIARGSADPARIALWGWSYGGYMTAYALTHSTRWTAGIAGAPVTDWRLYDSIYTERYMDLPAANPAGYEKGSVIAAADKLSGELLLVHGAIDENVHAQNTLQLAKALQEAGKPFQLMLYPGNRHHVANQKQRVHLYRTMTEFLRESLSASGASTGSPQ